MNQPKSSGHKTSFPLKDCLVVGVLVTLILGQCFTTKNTTYLFQENNKQDEINTLVLEKFEKTDLFLEYLPRALNNVFYQIKAAFIDHETRIQTLEKKNEEVTKP